MVAIKNGLRFIQVKAFLTLVVPWQIKHSIQISAHHTLLRIRATQFGKAVDLANQLVLTLLRQMEVKHTLAVALSLGCDILLAQFALNHLDLLAQIILTLIFVDLTFQFILNLIFNLEDLSLLTKQTDHHRQTARSVELLQNLLLRLDLHR